jgi:hypothetical protein
MPDADRKLIRQSHTGSRPIVTVKPLRTIRFRAGEAELATCPHRQISTSQLAITCCVTNEYACLHQYGTSLVVTQHEPALLLQIRPLLPIRIACRALQIDWRSYCAFHQDQAKG